MTTTAPMDLIFDWYFPFLIFTLIGGVVVGWLTRHWPARVIWVVGYTVFWLFIFSAHYQQMASAVDVLVAAAVWGAIFVGALLAGVILQDLIVRIGVMRWAAKPTLGNGAVFLLFVLGMIATLMGAKASGLRTVTHPMTGVGTFFATAVPGISVKLGDEMARSAGNCAGYLRVVGERDDDQQVRDMSLDILILTRHRVDQTVFQKGFDEGSRKAREDEGNRLAVGRKITECRQVLDQQV